jgi:hypothetical protein
MSASARTRCWHCSPPAVQSSKTGTIVASMSPSAAILDGAGDPPDLLAKLDTAQGVQDWECVR